MILEQVSLRNWRGFRGDGHHFSFGEGANLLVGPNESGKSTILEAIRRGLLDRHSARGQALQRIRPLGSSLAPEVRLVFRSRGRRYCVLKRFLENVASEVRVERDGEFQLDHEGDAADRFLRNLLLADDTTRGTLRPEQRGLAQALWFLQSDEGIPSGRWSEALEASLKRELAKAGGGVRGLVNAAASVASTATATAAQIEAVERRLSEDFERHFTPTGRLKARGEIATLEASLEEVVQELERRLEERQRASRHRLELEEIQQEEVAVLAKLGALAAQRRPLIKQLAQEDELLSQIAALEKLTEAAERRKAECAVRSRTVAALDQRIGELDRTLRDGEEAVARLRVAVREHRRSAERHARAWEDELSPKLEAIRQQIADLQALQRMEQLEAEVQRSNVQIERRRTLTQQAEAAKERLSQLVQVDEAVWDRARALAERANTLRDRAWAAGMRIALCDLPAGTLSFDPDPEVDDSTGELVMAHETRITVEGAGTFTLRSADKRLGAFDREARACRAELERLFDQFGAADERQLLTLREKTLEAQRRVQRADDLLAEMSESDGEPVTVEDLERHRMTTVAELEQLRARCPQSVLPGMEGWAERRTLDALLELEEKRASLENRIKEERETEQAAQQKSLSSHELLEKVSVSTAADTSERTALRERLAAELEAFEDRIAFEAAGGAASKEVARLIGEAKTLHQKYSEEIERPRKSLLEIDSQVAKAEQRHQELVGQQTDRRARLEEVGALSLDRQITDLEVREGTLRKRLETVNRRAKATALLRRLFDHRRTEQSSSWVEPVSQLVEQWMVRLSGGGAIGVDFDTDLVPQGVSLDGQESTLPLASLSHGAGEQLIVLLRLALGVVLSVEERQLVVLDDRLVNADVERGAVLGQILNEAAEHCQVLIATCRIEGYDTVQGRRLDVARRGGFLAAAERK